MSQSILFGMYWPLVNLYVKPTLGLILVMPLVYSLCYLFYHLFYHSGIVVCLYTQNQFFFEYGDRK